MADFINILIDTDTYRVAFKSGESLRAVIQRSLEQYRPSVGATRFYVPQGDSNEELNYNHPVEGLVTPGDTARVCLTRHSIYNRASFTAHSLFLLCRRVEPNAEKAQELADKLVKHEYNVLTIAASFPSGLPSSEMIPYPTLCSLIECSEKIKQI